LNRLNTDELRLKLRIPVLEEHLDDFTEVALEFVQAGALAMGSRPTGNVTNVDSGVWVTLYDNVEDAHTDGSS